MRECPFCEARLDPAFFARHVRTFHRDRMAAARLYAQRVAAGATTAEARLAANQLLLRLAGGPGTYVRGAA